MLPVSREVGHAARGESRVKALKERFDSLLMEFRLLQKEWRTLQRPLSEWEYQRRWEVITREAELHREIQNLIDHAVAVQQTTR